MVLSRWLGLNIFLDAATANFLDFLDDAQVNAVLVIDIAVGIGAGYNLGTEFLGLLDGVGGNIAGAGNNNGLILVVNACISQHELGEVQETVASSLGAGQAAAVVQALAGKNAGIVGIADPLVLAIEVADFTAAYADISGRYVSIEANVTAQLSHKALAETHDFGIGLALRVKVGATLATADWQGSEGILENLLKAQELDDAQVYGRVQAKATLVWANGTVELDTIALVYMNLAGIVSPRHTEHNHTLRLYNPLQDGLLLILRVLV